MSGFKAVAVAVGGLFATVVLLMLVALGIQLVRGAEDRPPVPLWERAAWDGTQFVINDPARLGLGNHWTSSDGMEWTQRNDLSLAGQLYGCHPNYRCEVVPEESEPVPFHFARTTAFVRSGRDGVILVEASTNYSSVRDDPLDPTSLNSIEIHPALLSRAARDSECFAALEAAERSGAPEGSTASLVAFGEGFQGADWIFEATCQDQEGSDRFALNLSRVLTDRQFDLLTNGGDSELFVSRSDGTIERIAEPPRASFWADGVEGGELIVSLSAIAATGTGFWTADDGTLVSSPDGLSWSPVDLDAVGDRRVSSVVANLGGDIAVLLVDDERLVERGSKEIIVSHDDGLSWTDPITVAADGEHALLTSVGPAGVSLALSGPGSPETKVFIDDDRGEIGFTSDLGLGSDALTVGRETILLPRDLIGPTGEVVGPGLDVYDTTGRLLATVEP